MSLSPGSRIGGFEIIAPLGEGGMGVVYRARDARLGRDVALKILPAAFAEDAERLARFEREARTLASLNHPHIAQVYGFDEAAPAPGQSATRALVMELVDGEDLSARIARGAMPLDEALPLARQMAEALEAAHEAGIVHRDLKPANIKVRPDGTVKVLDFGLAKPGATGASRAPGAVNSPTITSPAALTMGGMILGTAAYMSPEQARGRAVDKRADIWAFGVVLYEMLSGRAAFAGDTVTDTIAAVVTRSPDWTLLPPSTPSSIRRLLTRCLDKEVKQRLPDIGVARLEIDEAIELSRGSGAPGDASASSSTRPAHRRPIALILASVAAIAFAAASLLLWMTRNSSAPPPRLARLAVSTAPATEVASTQGGSVAIAPFGDVIAFMGSRNGVRALYIRHLDQPEARELAGSAAATGPFFSPDGQWLAYTNDLGSSGARLVKVSVATGTQTTLATLPEAPRGAVWTRSGDIIVGVAQGPLHRVSGDGGGAVPLAPLAAGEEAHRWPDVLLDDEHVVFSAGAPTLARWDTAPLHVQNVRTGVRQALGVQGTRPRFVPPDRLIFNRDDRLFVVTFDPGALKISGVPTAVLENLTNLWNTGAAQYDISASGSLLFSPPDNTTGVSMARIGSRAGEEPLPVALRSYTAPIISSDGRFAAVEMVDEADDIWIVNLQTGAPQRLTFNDDEDETPVLSADDVWVAYASTRGGSRQILRRRADGGGPEETLWKGSEHVHVHDWTPDGRYLLTSAVAEGTGSGLSLLDLQATPPAVRPLMAAGAAVTSAQVTRDGRWIVYASAESGRSEIYVQDFPRLGSRWQVSQAGGLNPLWTEEGRALYYRRGATLYKVPVDNGGTALKFGAAIEVYNTLPAVKGDHRSYGVFPNGDALVLKSTTGDRSDHLNLFQHWTTSLGLGSTPR